MSGPHYGIIVKRTGDMKLLEWLHQGSRDYKYRVNIAWNQQVTAHVSDCVQPFFRPSTVGDPLFTLRDAVADEIYEVY